MILNLNLRYGSLRFLRRHVQLVPARLFIYHINVGIKIINRQLVRHAGLSYNLSLHL